MSAAPGAAQSDQLGSISWADESHVAPASEPLAPASAATPPSAGQRDIAPRDIGRSAFSEQLGAANARGPEGWETRSLTDSGARGEVGKGGEGWGGGPTRLIREWGPVLLAAVVIALFTRLVLVQAYHIPSLSMAPTLDKGDRVIVNRLSYNFGEVERGQVIVFEKPPNQQSDANDLIKRVIGLPGETMQFRDGEVYVDGLLVEEPYLAAQSSSRPRSFSIPGCAQPEPSPTECLVPDGYVFVMGDNRNGSQDSRSFGPIAQDTIVGRAFIVVWPFSDINRL